MKKETPTLNRICKLCELPILNKVRSHIIPRFMFENLKDDKNAFFNGTISKSNIKTKKVQHEYYDNEILCRECDNTRLNKYEAYVSKNWYHPSSQLFKNLVEYQSNEITYSNLPGINYLLLKKFLLSILWRASITTIDFFNEVDLGKKHEDRIRDILFNDSDVKHDEYPIILYFLDKRSTIFENMFPEPTRVAVKHDDVRFNVYLFIFENLQIAFYVNNPSLKVAESINQFSIKPDNVNIFHLNESLSVNSTNIYLSKL